MVVNPEIVKNKPTRALDRLLGDGSIKVDGTRYPVYLLSDGTTVLIINTDGSLPVQDVRPSAVAITNVTISDNEWTPIVTGLSDVLKWRLSEKKGANFDYAYTVAPATFATGFGNVKWDTAITAVYAKRQGDVDLNMQLEVWKL